MEKAKRYIVFFIGLFINALGISFITKADLGTSPISSIPYTLSFYFPFYVRGIYGGVQCVVDSVTDFAAAEQI